MNSKYSKSKRRSSIRENSGIIVSYMVVLVIISSFTVLLYFVDLNGEKSVLEQTETEHATLITELITSELNSIFSDTLFLGENNELQDMLLNDSITNKRAVEEHFMTFIRIKGIYDQLRFLDETGMEIVRVNYNNSSPYSVAEDELQNKSQRYYFDESYSIERNEVYVSPMDLNIEHGKIEEPLKPMIRFGTPVFDPDTTTKRGIVLLNYLAETLLDKLKENTPLPFSEMTLLNSDGYWLLGLQPEDEWGFMYPNRENKTLNYQFPSDWAKINSSPAGQYYSDLGLFTFSTVYPLIEGQNSSAGLLKSDISLKEMQYYWKVLHIVSSNYIDTIVNTIIIRNIMIFSIIFSIITVGGIFQSRISSRRKIAELALHESRQNYQMLIENLEEGVILEDTQGNMTYLNPRLTHMLGYTEEELMGKHTSLIVPNKELDKVRKETAKRPFGFSSRYETVLQTKDERVIPVIISANPILGDTGDFKGVLSVVTDISEQKKLQQLQDRFISTTSHELRTPITIIKGYNDFLLSNPELTMEKRNLIRTSMASNIERLIRLIDTVHDLTNINHNLFTIIPVETNLDDFVQTLQDQSSLLYPMRSIMINYIRYPNNPTIFFDHDRILQVLHNLISNAVKNSSRTSVVKITFIRFVDGLQISVQDQGVGIPFWNFLHLFQPFSHQETPYSRQGTGIGLFIVKTIVIAHGGRIEVLSQEHEGSIFTITIFSNSPVRSSTSTNKRDIEMMVNHAGDLNEVSQTR